MFWLTVVDGDDDVGCCNNIRSKQPRPSLQWVWTVNVIFLFHYSFTKIELISVRSVCSVYCICLLSRPGWSYIWVNPGIGKICWFSAFMNLNNAAKVESLNKPAVLVHNKFKAKQVEGSKDLFSSSAKTVQEYLCLQSARQGRITFCVQFHHCGESKQYAAYSGLFRAKEMLNLIIHALVLKLYPIFSQSRGKVLLAWHIQLDIYKVLLNLELP